MRAWLVFLGVVLVGAVLVMKGCWVQAKNNRPTTIGFVGDVMLGRLVNETIAREGALYPWGNMRLALHANDVTIANLETTLTTSEARVPKVFNFKADPTRVQVLQEGNIGLVNLANNHSLDFGVDGLRETIATLNQAGIAHVGAGNNRAAAHAPAIVERGGMRIGLLGYTDNEPDWQAGQYSPGVAYVRIGDIDAVRDDIQTLRPSVDLLIVSLHWGPNMVTTPSQVHLDFAHALIDLGADIIHGHSAHVVQGVEIYKNKLILYDTGDFVDDYAVDPDRRNDLSFLFTVSADHAGLVRLALVPVLIDSMQVNKALGRDARTIIEMMQQRSQAFGTVFYEVNGELQLSLR